MRPGANPVYLTWAAVNTCWVSTCSGDLPAQLLGGLPCQYFAGKKWQPFFKMAAMRN